MIQKIFLATHNPGKIERFKLILEQVEAVTTFKIQIVTPKDLGLAKFEVEENGKDEQENAYIKAKAYFEALPNDQKMPCFASDTGCYFEGVLADEQPGQMVRRIVGKGESATDQDLVDFYQKLCRKYGGQIKGYYLDANCIYAGIAQQIDKIGVDELYFGLNNTQFNFIPNGEVTDIVLENTNHRHILMTDQVVGELNPGFPMMSMWKGGITGKYHADMSPDDYLNELSPLILATTELIQSLPDEGTLILGKYLQNMPVRRRSLGVLKVGDDKYMGFIKKPTILDLEQPKEGESLKDDRGSALNMLTWAGGGVDPGENPSQAVVREIIEELGYTDLKPTLELGGKIIHYFKGPNYQVCSVTYGFEVEITDLSKRQNAEIDDGFYSTETLSKTDFLEQSQIEVAREFLKRVK